jgi:hypothetical protein
METQGNTGQYKGIKESIGEYRIITREYENKVIDCGLNEN